MDFLRRSPAIVKNEYNCFTFIIHPYNVRRMHMDATKILGAAEQRFAHYGYGKTPMAEIAEDVNISVGNLYRFFKNKEALVLASTEKLLSAKLEEGLLAAASATSSCGALRAFLLASVRLAHAHFADNRHLSELIELNNLRHREMLLSYETKVIDAMANILEEGMLHGNIISGDAHRTAYLVHQTLLRYNNPISLKRNGLETLETDLHDTLELLYVGLAC